MFINKIFWFILFYINIKNFNILEFILMYLNIYLNLNILKYNYYVSVLIQKYKQLIKYT